MTLEDLLAIEAIRQLKARYLRAMDTSDWDLLESVFALDARLDVRGGVSDMDAGLAGSAIETSEVVSGRAAIVAFMRGNLERMRCAHYALLPEITLLSPDTASAIWAQHDELHFPHANGEASLQGYGYYHDRYVRIAGEWRIAQTRLERLFVRAI
jgi:hypothetical protein